MAKPHRGKGIRELFAHGRGTCPVCKRENVKVLYEQEAGDQKFKICKTCRAAIKNGKKSLPVTVTAKAPEADVKVQATAEPAPAKTEAPAKAEAETPAADEAAATEAASESAADEA